MFRTVFFVLVVALAGSWGCKGTRTMVAAPTVDTARWAMRQVVAHYGGDLYYLHKLSFSSRERRYSASFDRSGYRYERRASMMDQQMVDVLDAQSFRRTVDGGPVSMAPSDREEAANTLHQVIFFAVLPHFLRDTAIIAQYLGRAELDGQAYYRVKLGFREASGGRSLSDEYIFWIDPRDFSLHYVAYSFERNGGGARFLHTIGTQVVQGILFNDYESFMDPNGNRDLLQLAKLFEAGQLQSVAKVELKDIAVERK